MPVETYPFSIISKTIDVDFEDENPTQKMHFDETLTTVTSEY